MASFARSTLGLFYRIGRRSAGPNGCCLGLVAAEDYSAIRGDHNRALELSDPTPINGAGFPFVGHVVVHITLDHDRLDRDHHPFDQRLAVAWLTGKGDLWVLPHPVPKTVTAEAAGDVAAVILGARLHRPAHIADSRIGAGGGDRGMHRIPSDVAEPALALGLGANRDRGRRLAGEAVEEDPGLNRQEIARFEDIRPWHAVDDDIVRIRVDRAGETGLGGLVQEFGSFFQTGYLIAAIISSTALAFIAFWVLSRAQNYFFPWIRALSARR